MMFILNKNENEYENILDEKCRLEELPIAERREFNQIINDNKDDYIDNVLKHWTRIIYG